MMLSANKFLSLLMLIALLVSACQPIMVQPLDQSAAQTTEEANNLQIARRYMEELWNEGNLEIYDELIAPDFVDLAPRPGFGTDRTAFREDLEGFHQDFPDQMAHFTIEEMIAAGDWVTLRGDFVVSPPDAPEPATTEYAVMLRIEDGLIRERWGVFNELALMTGMGFTLTPPEAAATPAVALREGGAIARVNDIEMYYEIRGEGEPLLLIHGAIGSTADFDEVLSAFHDAGFQTIAIDCRGRGRSTDSGQMLTYALMAEDAITLMDELGIEKASIAGQSDGAMIGLHMAIHFPERVDKLISYGANFNVGGLLPRNVAWLESLTQADMEAMFGEGYRQLAPDPDHLPVLLEQLRHMFLTQPDFTIADLMGIEAEVLVFDGEEEDTVRIEHAKQMAAAIPNASMVILPDTGHHLMYEDPETYLDYAIPFLTGELNAPPEGKYAAVNGIEMYYEIHGEGEPLLLIHSVAAHSAQFADVIPALAEDYQVIAVDFRGHGRTIDSGQPLSYELIASDMIALLDQLDIDAVHIVGNKDGGITGLVMATQHPERVKSLVTASVNWSPAGFQPWFVDWLKGVTLEEWDGMVGEMYRTVAPEPSIMAVMLEKDRNMLLTQPTFTLEQLSTIDVPVLVLAGADEEVVELPHIEQMAAALPNAELMLIDGGGHGVLEEQFDVWMAAVQAFLTKHVVVE